MVNNPQANGRNDGHSFDYTKIAENLFLGSDFCKGGVCLLHGQEFKKLGISVEINLTQEENELPPNNVEVYLWLPTIDGHAPSQLALDTGTSVINSSLVSDRGVYVHCKNGHGRSPTVIAAYLIRFGKKSPESAMEFISNLRGEVHFEETQIESLVNFAERWKNG